MGNSNRPESVDDLQISFNQMTARDLPLETTARIARETGFEGIGVLPATIDRLGARGVAAVLDAEGLRATSVSAFVGLIDPSPEAQMARMTAAARMLAAAAELGVPLVTVVGGPTPLLSPRQAWERALTAMDELLERAEQEGAEVLVEPLHPVLAGESVATSVADAQMLIGRSDAGGIVVDTWHVWWDTQLREQVRRAGGRIRIVHLSDWAAGPGAGLDRVLPGKGISDLPAICADLLDGGFGGWWELEILAENLRAEDQVSLIRASYNSAREVLGTALSLAKENGARTESGQ
ncbi:sugar phosphate isomerase/epimerase family protein [Nonomuraea sp. NPDC051941]|uniref:sugar phosphate isomerase/epimerase family protein n=1 Tax=Nonomuraea sp. NPDC051941 TaxID=3364373 RepID=UPI0037C740DA